MKTVQDVIDYKTQDEYFEHLKVYDGHTSFKDAGDYQYELNELAKIIIKERKDVSSSFALDEAYSVIEEWEVATDWIMDAVDDIAIQYLEMTDYQWQTDIEENPSDWSEEYHNSDEYCEAFEVLRRVLAWELTTLVVEGGQK